MFFKNSFHNPNNMETQHKTELKIHYNDGLVRICIDGIGINADEFITKYLIDGTASDRKTIRADFKRIEKEL